MWLDILVILLHIYIYTHTLTLFQTGCFHSWIELLLKHSILLLAKLKGVALDFNERTKLIEFGMASTSNTLFCFCNIFMWFFFSSVGAISSVLLISSLDIPDYFPLYSPYVQILQRLIWFPFQYILFPGMHLLLYKYMLMYLFTCICICVYVVNKEIYIHIYYTHAYV